MNRYTRLASMMMLMLLTGVTVQAHPPISLRDNNGVLAQKSGLAISNSETCGDCHDTGFIAKHNTHAGLNEVKGSTTATQPESDCFVCHIDVSDLVDQGEPDSTASRTLGSMSTLAKTKLVKKQGNYWRWNSSTFLKDGRIKDVGLGLRSPENVNCLQCHKMSPDQLAEIVNPELSHPNSDVFSGEKLNRSSFNISNKSSHNHSWDVHAEKLVKCVNCHYSDNHPVYYREPEATRPAHLKFDSRKLSYKEYIAHPSHQLANAPDNNADMASCSECCVSCHNKGVGHDFLEAKEQHFRSLSCESCHISETYLSAISTIDYTILDPAKRPLVNRVKKEGAEEENGVLVGHRPLLLLTSTTKGEKFKPYRMATTWSWKDSSNGEVISPLLVEKAYFENGHYKKDIITQFDSNNNQTLENEELIINSNTKKELIVRLLVEQGVGKPVIQTEVQPIGIHHGVVGQKDIVKECTECHSQDSRLTGSFTLADETPIGAETTGMQPMKYIIGGSITRNQNDALKFSPQIETSEKYIFSAIRNPWVDSIGFIAFLGVLFGVFVHGGLRTKTRRALDHQEVKMEKVYIYKVYERIWHWIQALSILLFIFTGLEIHFAGQMDILGIKGALDLHNITAVVFIISGILGLFFFLSTGGIKQYFPPVKTLIPDILNQAKYYGFGIFKGDPHPTNKTAERRLNSLQQVTYLGLMFGLIPLQTITGILLFTADRWPQLINTFGGIDLIGPFHTLVAWLFISFLVMHIYLTTTGHTIAANLKAMVNGWEDVELSINNKGEHHENT
jgi:thiosulfate reductase cytochrome b subunit